jgi:hypothetical protein
MEFGYHIIKMNTNKNIIKIGGNDMLNNNNEMNNIMKAVELEMELKKVAQRIETTLVLNEAWMEFTDKEYKNKLRDLKLLEKARSKMTDLLILATAVKDIEHQAIVIKDMDLYSKSSAKEAKIINQMELIRNKYDY